MQKISNTYGLCVYFCIYNFVHFCCICFQLWFFICGPIFWQIPQFMHSPRVATTVAILGHHHPLLVTICHMIQIRSSVRLCIPFTYSFVIVYVNWSFFIVKEVEHLWHFYMISLDGDTYVCSHILRYTLQK